MTGGNGNLLAILTSPLCGRDGLPPARLPVAVPGGRPPDETRPAGPLHALHRTASNTRQAVFIFDAFTLGFFFEAITTIVNQTFSQILFKNLI